MEDVIKQYCLQKGLLKQGDRILLGFSGGADSVCLFLMLLSMQSELNLTILPVHIHHNLRDEEADSDQRFCEEFCRQHGLTLVVRSIPVRQLAKEHNWSLEEAGRNARYDAFHQLAEEYQCTRIAVAHHQNDQAETVLFQLIRGSRIRGLCGMEPKSGMLIRPLLAVTRQEIEEYLTAQNQDYCIDSTNCCVEYTRNRLRHRLLPEASAIQQRAVEHIAKTAEYLQRVEKYLEKEADKLYACAVKEDSPPNQGVCISIPLLQDAEPLLAEHVIYRVLCEVTGQKKDIVSDYVSMCMELLQKQTGKKLSLPKNVVAERSYDVLKVKHVDQVSCIEEEFEIPVEEFPFSIYLPQRDVEVTFRLLEVEENLQKTLQKYGGIPKSTYTKWFDYDKMRNGVLIRTPKQDDFIALYTDGKGKSLQAVLTDYKVPKNERTRTAVIAEGNRILWIPGVRSSEAYRITDMTKRILTVSIHGGKE